MSESHVDIHQIWCKIQFNCIFFPAVLGLVSVVYLHIWSEETVRCTLADELSISVQSNPPSATDRLLIFEAFHGIYRIEIETEITSVL